MSTPRKKPDQPPPDYVEDNTADELRRRLVDLEEAERARQRRKRNKRSRKELVDVCVILERLECHDMRRGAVTPMTAAILSGAVSLRSLIMTYMEDYADV